MDYARILRKKERYDQAKDKIPEITVKSYVQAFELEFTHNSTAIEGNTLTLLETKVVLEEGQSVGGKQLREIYEVVNHHKAYQYVKSCISQNRTLDEAIITDIHAMLMDHIMIGGIYRNVEDFHFDLAGKSFNAIELAAWTHAEFVRIHPFADGNGRTSRLLMNYQLMTHGFLPVSITKESRLEYFNALDAYGVHRDLEPFIDMIAALEEQQLDRYLGMIDRLDS